MRVLPSGADFQWIPSDTASVLDARYGLETDAGDLICVRNHAVRSAPAQVMAALMRGEPVDPREHLLGLQQPGTARRLRIPA